MKRPKRIDLKPEELAALLARVEKSVDEKDYEIIKAMADTIEYLSQMVDQKGVSIKRLVKMMFGSASEKTRKVLEEAIEKQRKKSRDASEKKKDKKKPKGHGRNGADDYTGAERVTVAHPSLRPCDRCPACRKGKVYKAPPRKIVRVKGQAPLQATVYELSKLRCNLCGEIFTAEPPEGIGTEKYDATTAAMIGLLKYGSGLPFNRIDRLQGDLGIPLPASTQWEIVERAADRYWPAFEQLVVEAAQGEVIYNDDTVMKVLELIKERQTDAASDETTAKRTGVFTSGIVSTVGDRRMAVFFTGGKHAGENLAALLENRRSQLEAPIQMCDALSRNQPKGFAVILANCLAHGRRRFVDVADNFPDECLYVLDTLGKVYGKDEDCKEQDLSPEERLKYHQQHSKSLMNDLHEWLTTQFKENKVEPNSSLGQAIGYMLNHWQPLTLFLRQPNAPLDNNICENSLKKAILHRKNSLFYKTQHGARVGDLFMSLIYTCYLTEHNPFEYLNALYDHATELKTNPQQWMPWNYTDSLPQALPPT